jgi:hypothetical protein
MFIMRLKATKLAKNRGKEVGKDAKTCDSSGFQAKSLTARSIPLARCIGTEPGNALLPKLRRKAGNILTKALGIAPGCFSSEQVFVVALGQKKLA